jgi:hypothetical protein
MLLTHPMGSFGLLFALVSGAAAATTINNLAPRLDVNGVIVDAHDGSVQMFGGKPPFYMHAVQYGLCHEPANYGCDSTPDRCGFQYDHNITVYTTNDLSSGTWQFVGTRKSVRVQVWPRFTTSSRQTWWLVSLQAMRSKWLTVLLAWCFARMQCTIRTRTCTCCGGTTCDPTEFTRAMQLGSPQRRKVGEASTSRCPAGLVHGVIVLCVVAQDPSRWLWTL